VRVHDGCEVAGGASGRNGGFALRGGAPPYDIARDQLGPDRAAELWRLTERALERMAALAGDAFRPTGSLRLANDRDEAVALQAEYEALREDGFAAEWRPELGGRLFGRFEGALFHPTDGSIHPARWVRRLAARAADAGAEFREHDRVESLDELEAEQVVIATDGYTQGLVDELDRIIRPTRGQVVVTAPLGEELYPCPHYARYGYDYWQQTPDLRLVLGGFRDLAIDEEWTAQEEMATAIQARLEAYAEVLAGGPVEISRRWCGIFGMTEDLLPVVGPVCDGVWAACGYSGHGNVLGLACGELVGQAIAGDPAPELSLFDGVRAL
jgi:gamma-glutamylputrescine oxidase